MPQSLSDEEREELTAYLAGEGEADTRAEIAAKVKRDPAWRAEAESLKQAWAMLDQLKAPAPSSTFTSQTMTKLMAITTPVPSVPATPILRRVPWRWIVAAVLGLATGWLVTGMFAKSRGPVAARIDDPQLVRELRLIENLPLYFAVETLDYLQALDQHDRFGADSLGP